MLACVRARVPCTYREKMHSRPRAHMHIRGHPHRSCRFHNSESPKFMYSTTHTHTHTHRRTHTVFFRLARVVVAASWREKKRCPAPSTPIIHLNHPTNRPKAPYAFRPDVAVSFWAHTRGCICQHSTASAAAAVALHVVYVQNGSADESASLRCGVSMSCASVAMHSRECHRRHHHCHHHELPAQNTAARISSPASGPGAWVGMRCAGAAGRASIFLCRSDCLV